MKHLKFPSHLTQQGAQQPTLHVTGEASGWPNNLSACQKHREGLPAICVSCPSTGKGFWQHYCPEEFSHRCTPALSLPANQILIFHSLLAMDPGIQTHNPDFKMSAKTMRIFSV